MVLNNNIDNDADNDNDHNDDDDAAAAVDDNDCIRTLVFLVYTENCVQESICLYTTTDINSRLIT